MFAAVGNRWNFEAYNLTAGNWGQLGSSITPGNNTFPAYTEILSDTAVTQDCYGIMVYISNSNSVGLARDTLVNIGADPAGGSTFTTIIPNLLGSVSANGGPGHVYYFPLYIKSGTALAAQASANNATPGSLRVGLRLWGAPSRPEVVRAGSFITAFGATTASSSGTAITPGSSSAEGAAWVQLGSNLTQNHWWWQVGIGINNAAMGGFYYAMDVAAGSGISANDVIIKDEIVQTTNAEAIHKTLGSTNYYAEVPSGQGVFGRASCSGVPDTGVSMMAYGLGG